MVISKQQKIEEKAKATTMKEDIISSLPDSVLCHILSFLPTRSSMATSILSRRWRHLWKDLQVFDIADKPFYVCGHFVAFIKGVLAQLRVRPIQKFRLSCVVQITRHDTVTAWIRTAIGPHLQELDLFLSVSDKCDGFYLPCVISTCASLVSLTLKGSILWYNPPSVHLPSLKNLELDIHYVEPIDKLLSGCPILETLKIAFHAGYRMAIHMPHSLKSLTFEVDYDDEDDILDLKIDTPSLEYLHIKLRPKFLIYFVSNFPNMMEAHLDIFPYDTHVGWIPKLLKALCRTKLLALTNRIIECLLRAPALHFPEFCCLVHLRLDFQCFNSSFLIHFLSNCDMLRVLIINNWNYKGEHSESSSWTLPTSVPNCVKSQLKNFEFEGYHDTADEHAFTAFLLQRGLVLETMTIHSTVWFRLAKKYRILKELSTIPRGSITCQLKFD